MSSFLFFFFFFQAEDGIRDAQESRGLGDVYKRQVSTQSTGLTHQHQWLGDIHSSGRQTRRLSSRTPTRSFGCSTSPGLPRTARPASRLTFIEWSRCSREGSGEGDTHHHQVAQGLVEAQTRQARPQVQSQKAAGLQDQRETAESEVGAAPGLLPYSSVLLAHFSVPLAHYSVPLAPESVLLAY
eukprot:TRINITY_DN6627_c0_g1_i6.p1 TRINITY_DN6627_c0_g1~~TRINITY_DN6627_c0_g1_i6.p1  ORF type:complete len:184 (+),score=28.44 TRINITY_DN6627_c0_g1_i6:73-624(+)